MRIIRSKEEYGSAERGEESENVEGLLNNLTIEIGGDRGGGDRMP